MVENIISPECHIVRRWLTFVLTRIGTFLQHIEIVRTVDFNFTLNMGLLLQGPKTKIREIVTYFELSHMLLRNKNLKSAYLAHL